MLNLGLSGLCAGMLTAHTMQETRSSSALLRPIYEIQTALLIASGSVTQPFRNLHQISTLRLMSGSGFSISPTASDISLRRLRPRLDTRR
ncbi:hypothetical protein BD310DRAFT_919891 [Dichomitus squalens]|uniref:Uncharacterized protein n=1 Tax=Dichomitus squalens TaxID=114155 RepID=A0A4Q9Q4G0_9APHY|nr:hypothetical protein BD310DRAFT_919891 [Dichomitus squalens]